MLKDQVETLQVGRYWSEVVCSTIMTHPGMHLGQCHGHGNFVLIKGLVIFYVYMS